MTTAENPVETLTAEQAAVALERLAAEIAEHDRRYHRRIDAAISDAEYDALRIRNAEIEARFPELVRPNSPSLKVGAAPSGTFGQVRHARPMLSLDNAFADEDVLDFVAGVRRFLAWPAGRAARLHRRAQDRRPVDVAPLRERGRLVTAATRGDGDDRRERDRQHPHHSRDPRATAEGRAATSSRCAAKSTCAATISWRSTSAWRKAARSSPIPATRRPAACASSTRR